MPAVTGRDGEPYHKACTFALFGRTADISNLALSTGSRSRKPTRKWAEGDTASGQNSFRAPNHMCDVPDTCWATWRCGNARSGETVSPARPHVLRKALRATGETVNTPQQFESESSSGARAHRRARRSPRWAERRWTERCSAQSSRFTESGLRPSTVAVRYAELGAVEVGAETLPSVPGRLGDDGGRSRAEVLALIVGIAAIGVFAAGRMPRKSDIGCDEAAAEKPLFSRETTRASTSRRLRERRKREQSVRGRPRNPEHFLLRK